MLTLVLAASFGVYHWHQRRKEALEERISIAVLTLTDGVDWARKDCKKHELSNPFIRATSGIYIKKLELGWIDLQCRGETDRARPAAPRNDAGNNLDEKLELYEDTTNNILN